MARTKRPKKTQAEIWQEVRLDPEKLKHFKFNWCKNMIRLGSYRWPGRFNAKKRNYIEVPVTFKSGETKLVERCYCSSCGIIEIKKFFQIDHISPCIPETGWVSFDSYLDRMMCLEEDQRVLCKPCHQDVTNSQTEERVSNRKKKKS